MDIRSYENCMINLIKATISNEKPQKVLEGIDIGLLLNCAAKHSVANLIYEPLKSLDILTDETEQRMKAAYMLAAMNDEVQIHYLEIIKNAFEENEIEFCVLKGPIIKKLYPKSEYRQSGDLDIYVPEKYREKAKAVMLSLGFSIDRYNEAVADDAYAIGEKIHVELHRILVSNKTPWQKECQRITERLVLTDGKKYEHEMTKEDYYLYMIAHMAKHMIYSGMGIKMVLDVWIYLNKYNDTLDWNVLSDRLTACGLLDFEKSVKRLVKLWFYNEDEDKIIQKMGDYVFVSGTFGTEEQLNAYFQANDAGATNSKSVAKIRYFWHFFFQPYKWMCERYPILKKVPVLLPFCWVHRALKTLLFERDKAKQIASKYDNVDLTVSKKIQNFKKEIGL